MPSTRVKTRGASRLPASALVTLVAAVAAAPASARIILVNPDASGDYTTIAQAIRHAAPFDEIVLGDGVFTGHGNWRLEIGKPLTIRSASGDPTKCVIDLRKLAGSALWFMWLGPDRPCVVAGITIRGAIWANLVDVASSHVTFRNVRLYDAGGIGATIVAHGGSQCHVENSVIARNMGWDWAAGVGISDGTVATFDRCTFVDNSGRGHVACQDGALVKIERSILYGSILSEPVFAEDEGVVLVTESNVFGNEYGDWVGALEGLGDRYGNMSVDPLFCDRFGGDYTLRADSPCANVPGVGRIGALPVGCESAAPPSVPLATRLGPPRPNPSWGDVALTFDVSSAEAGTYSVRVFDLAGRRILARRFDVPSATTHEVRWDGRTGSGQSAPAGVYFVRVEGARFRETRKVVRRP